MDTTLNKIKEHSPCKESWIKLLDSLNKTTADDDPLELKYILDTLGVNDAIWSLRSLEGMDKEVRLFSCDCADSVLHIFEDKHPNDDRPRRAIEVSRLYANGKATLDELKTAAASAGAAATYATYAYYASTYAPAYAPAYAAPAYAPAYAAVAAAADAAYATVAADAERNNQKQLFIKYFC
jgi:hypothetical protein